MFRKSLLFVFFIFILTTFSACAQPTAAPNMANPASVFCNQHTGKSLIVTNADGSQTGRCVFPDGSFCEEWAYFRGECKPGQVPQSTSAPALETATPAANMPNPASVYCEQHGGKLEIVTNADGSQYGMCALEAGSCEEWAFMRGECQPGQAPTAETPKYETETPAPEGWMLYTNDRLGYSFLVPPEADIQSDDRTKSVNVIGSQVDNQQWPVIYIIHPVDRSEYHLPDGADLKQWLSDHKLLAGEVKADTKISSQTAIHTRAEKSEKSLAQDSYFFAYSGQIYNIVIVHTAKEDWDLYNTFLNSFHFN
jgi:putative hemolysin